MKFLPTTHKEYIPPATYRVWRRSGMVDTLPMWFCIYFPPVLFASISHEYLKVMRLVGVATVVIFVIALLPRRLGKPAVEITDDVLTVRMRFLIPSKVERIALDNLRRVIFAGPRGDRDWIFEFKGGERRALRPYLGDGVTKALTAILQKASAGRFSVIINKPYVPEP